MKITGRIFAAAVAVAALGVVTTVSYAESDPQGYIVFAADKNVIGQGFVNEPVRVPFYEGETGIDVVDRAADIITTDSDYGAYISAFADTDTGEEIPAEIAAVCPEMFGRTADGYLSNFDYTAESGWNMFINDESALVGISSYEPQDGDVVWFRFSVYGYGCDLGVDNSSWGGSAALVPAVKTAELMTALADGTIPAGSKEYSNAIAVLETYGAQQAEIDAALESGAETPADNAETEPDTDKASPDTGIDGVAVTASLAVLVGAAVMMAKKR